MTTVPRPLFVAIVNDSPLEFMGVTDLLHPFRHRVRVVELCRSSTSGGGADVVLYDPFMPAKALERLAEIALETGAPVLVYVRAVDDEQIDDAIEAGAVGFLSKEEDGVAMLVALEGVAASRKVLAVPTPDEASMAMWPGEREGLSARESVIVALIVAGMSDQDIANALYVSISSVGPCIRSAYRKMGVASRVQAVLWGIDHGFEIARHRPTQQWQRPVTPCALESA